MIKKILFTVLVAVGVFFFYKLKNREPEHTDKNPTHAEGKFSTQLVAYVIVGFMLLFSAIFFTLNWLDDNSMITVRVVNSQNNTTEYQIKKNELKGRSFKTVDGRIIELGENERLEILPQQ